MKPRCLIEDMAWIQRGKSVTLILQKFNLFGSFFRSCLERSSYFAGEYDNSENDRQPGKDEAEWIGTDSPSGEYISIIADFFENRKSSKLEIR